ncbi:MAG: hypothetical protein IAE80_15100 [Anaerolinea sp.]|nr:hypothetical protein [Anaerolinea sp.]
MTQDDKRLLPDDLTIATRAGGRERLTIPGTIPPEAKPTPWLLELYYRADSDFHRELASRFPQMPVMSLIHLHTTGGEVRFPYAMIATPDGAASLTVEIDPPSKAVCFTFALHSMLAFRFALDGLNDKDRLQWLQEMRAERGEIAFMWDQSRWQRDYLIGVALKHYTNLFAFSPTHAQAAVRLTSDVSRRLLDWLEGFWKVDLPLDATPPVSQW